jgi:hypothetical protein
LSSFFCPPGWKRIYDEWLSTDPNHTDAFRFSLVAILFLLAGSFFILPLVVLIRIAVVGTYTNEELGDRSVFFFTLCFSTTHTHYRFVLFKMKLTLSMKISCLDSSDVWIAVSLSFLVVVFFICVGLQLFLFLFLDGQNTGQDC